MTCGTKCYYFSVEFLRLLHISSSKTSWIDAKFPVSDTVSSSTVSLLAKQNWVYGSSGLYTWCWSGNGYFIYLNLLLL